jgi:hypothetical protein
MEGWKRYQKGLHHTGPFWVRFYGDNFVGTVFEETNVQRNVAWYVSGGQEPGAKIRGQGLAPSVHDAKFAADAAVLDRKRGRIATVEGEITSTDRNRRRLDRLLASERLARKLTDDLATFHRELLAAGDVKTADRIAISLRRAALSGLADYMRRTATIRVRSGPWMASPEETKTDAEAVIKIADQLDVLVDDSSSTIDIFETLTNELRRLGAFPDSDLYSAVVQSFLLKGSL